MEVTPNRPDRRLRLLRDKELNAAKPCNVWECNNRREGVSRFCSTHANRAGHYGSPTLKPIDRLTGINALSKQLAEQIRKKTLPDLENKLLASMAKWLPRERAYTYVNREIETGITAAEKARIILATALHNAGAERIIAFTALWAVTQEVDANSHSNADEWRKYFRSHLGGDVATLANIGRSWTEAKRTYRQDSWHWAGQEPENRMIAEERVRITKRQAIRGAVKRQVGKTLLDQLQNQLGQTRTWVADPWIAPYAEAIREKLSAVRYADREYPV